MMFQLVLFDDFESMLLQNLLNLSPMKLFKKISELIKQHLSQKQYF